MRSVLLVLMLTIVLTTLAPAATPDLSSPKIAARSLYVAIQAGDVEAVRESLYQGNAQQGELAGAMADLIVAGKKLGDAARARFGKAGDALGRGMLDSNDLARLDQSAVEIKEDRAKLTVPGQPRPMSFRRQDGRWRLVIHDLTNATPESIAKQTALVHMMAESMKTSAAELTKGDYKTAEEAVTAIQQRLHNVMLTFNRPSTTRATTNPTTNHDAKPTTTHAQDD